jgi:hypothetical protein
LAEPIRPVFTMVLPKQDHMVVKYSISGNEESSPLCIYPKLRGMPIQPNAF